MNAPVGVFSCPVKPLEICMNLKNTDLEGKPFDKVELTAQSMTGCNAGHVNRPLKKPPSFRTC